MEAQSIAEVAALLGDPTRATILVALMSGRALPAGELAAVANVSASTMSAHLAKLTETRLLAVEKQGRHRYYRLADPRAASLIEDLGSFASPPSQTPAELRFARTCYNHLAGHLAVQFNAAAQEAGLWTERADKQYELSASGANWLTGLGISVPQNRHGFARACLDWSERRHHISGPLGCALLNRFLDLSWIARTSRPRGIRLTLTGSEALRKQLHLEIRPE